MKPTKYFRVSDKEYCHITDDAVFIFNSKVPTRIPLEEELSNAWGISSILNYIVFVFLLLYTSMSLNSYGMNFFIRPINYGGILLLFLSLVRIKKGFQTSSTPTILRSKIRSVYLKSPKFSFPRLVIYFDGPEGKILSRTIRIMYKKEAIPVLEETGLLKKL
ncbi:MAG: hypothetical protein ACXVPU_12410 [Bacteroidia bacterium]